MGVTAPTATEILAAEAARRLGMTSTAIGQWCNRTGAPIRRQGHKTFVRWPDFARWREQELVKQAKAEVAPTVSLDEARTRKALAEAELAELEVAKSRGEFVAVADYEVAVGRILDRLMARLRAMPVRLSIHGADVEAAVEREVEHVIDELHQFDEDVLEEQPTQTREAA